jgi:hypothetical protein
MADAQYIIASKSVANTPSILSSTTALAANPARAGWSIQNLGTNTLFVLLGTGASTSVFHWVLKVSAVQDDGTGGTANQTVGTVYTGIITIAGTSPRYTVLEM